MISSSTFYSKKFISILILLIILLTTLSLFFGLRSQSLTPINPYKSSFNFDLYYPKNTVLKKGSITSANNILFFTVIKDGQEVNISEQINSSNSSTLKIDGFKTLTTPNGEMMVGNNNDLSLAVIRTDKTIINLQSKSKQNTKNLEDIGQSFKKL